LGAGAEQKVHKQLTFIVRVSTSAVISHQAGFVRKAQFYSFIIPLAGVLVTGSGFC
jgi:hypothetical protein